MQRDCNGQSVYLVGVWCGGLGGGAVFHTRKFPTLTMELLSLGTFFS